MRLCEVQHEEHPTSFPRCWSLFYLEWFALHSCFCQMVVLSEKAFRTNSQTKKPKATSQSFEDGASRPTATESKTQHGLFGNSRDPIMQKHDRDESAKGTKLSVVNSSSSTLQVWTNKSNHEEPNLAKGYQGTGLQAPSLAVPVFQDTETNLQSSSFTGLFPYDLCITIPQVPKAQSGQSRK